MKSSSCTGTHLNWRRNSKKQDDSVEDLMLRYVRTSLLLVVLVSNRIEAMCSAFWSAESEALQSADHCGPLKTRLYHSAKHCGPLKARLETTAKSQNFSTFLLYLDYELLLRSLRSNYELLLRSLRSLRSNNFNPCGIFEKMTSFSPILTKTWNKGN